MSFAMILLLASIDAVIFGPGGHFQLEQSNDSFGIRSYGIIEQLGSNQTKFYPLPVQNNNFTCTHWVHMPLF
jgi:hypothetical protein